MIRHPDPRVSSTLLPSLLASTPSYPQDSDFRTLQGVLTIKPLTLSGIKALTGSVPHASSPIHIPLYLQFSVLKPSSFAEALSFLFVFRAQAGGQTRRQPGQCSLPRQGGESTDSPPNCVGIARDFSPAPKAQFSLPCTLSVRLKGMEVEQVVMALNSGHMP